ncbi:DUF3862 domain-containing protein [Xylocopilactobacillus apis]|uniref:DUF3862 domain-containing protein n=1 Tax=Xylocopilactobacillus apis TaxID=2932183 RepID=A0AAU9D0S4_9LACO|nr:DUF3862 domain-containing protein [Xylocopilactobacillus apis]BDR55880.1 hypothetical protein KIMC2_04420 [Xylocopilactobacillus apis]
MNNYENNNKIPKRNLNQTDNPSSMEPENNPNQQNNFEVIPPNDKPKKAFYKKWWFWLLTILVIAAIAVTVFLLLNKKPNTENSKKESSSSKVVKKAKKKSKAKKNSASSTTASSTSKSSIQGSQPANGNKQNSNSAISKTGSALEVFSAIKLGDTAQNGTGGDTVADLKKKIGEGYKEDSINYQGKDATKVSWGTVIGITEGSGTMIIGVKNGTDYRVVSKTSVGISSDTKRDKITLLQFNQLQTNGLTGEKAVQLLGQPNAMTESHIGGKVFTSYTWNTNLQGDKNAFLTISFTDGVATAKNQQGLK